jgi:uncharacterized protein
LKAQSVLKLSISASGDGLSAKLKIKDFTLTEWRAQWCGLSGNDGPARLRSFIESQGIAQQNLREESIKWISEMLTESTDETRTADLLAVQGVDLAEGSAPLHEDPIGLTFHHSYLTNAEAIADLRRKADAWGFGGIRESIDPAYWVSSGATVLSFQSISKGLPGCDVFGAPIPFHPLADRLPAFGKSLFLKGRKLIAVCEGALIVEEGILKVLGADSLPTCQVVVADDKMSANLVLGGNYLNDWSVTMDMVFAAMREQVVLCMLPENEIQSALNRFNNSHLPLSLLIAKGRPPLRGKDGHLNILVDTEPEVPLPGMDGSIDFKNFSFFRSVAIGDRLAEVLPPMPGEAGLNVHGEQIDPPQAKAFGTQLGSNTELAGLDPLYLVASVSGRLVVKNGVPEVVKILEVVGDVSLKSGNIEFPGAVKVAGDVHNKMEIRAVGDVEVVGTVEDSIIHSDGSIVIQGGVNGHGMGLIKSRLSSVTIGYLHNQHIESNSHIVVFNEIINSQLLARKTITMKYGKYSVLGGHLLAGETIDLFNVGSEAGGKNILEVGKDFEVESDINKKKLTLISHGKDMDFLKAMDDKLTQVLRLRPNDSSEDYLLQKRSQGAMENLDRWVTSLRADLEELSRRLFNPEICKIMIRGIVYPGTVIKFQEKTLVVPTQLSNRKWIFRSNGPLPPVEGLPIG